MNEIVTVPIPVVFSHQVIFTRGVFSQSSLILRDLISSGNKNSRVKVVVFIDQGILDCNELALGEIQGYFQTHQDAIDLLIDPVAVPGGESAKKEWLPVERAIQTLYSQKLCRHSFVVIVGGGAVLDAIGFAASLVHRGIRQIRIPTTVLAQADAGIGIKNGIDYLGQKNFLGTFYPPFAVINDSLFLKTLNKKEWTAGMAEAVKVSLIRDREFFYWIENNAHALVARDLDCMAVLVKRSAELHLDHIARGGDPFERGSSRPLDFGHWSAHKLEQASNFEIGHGQAVAIGMALDSFYSREIGFLTSECLDRIVGLIQRLGFELWNQNLSPEILSGLEEFREHLGGELSIPLLTEIGSVLNVNEVDSEKMLHALEFLNAYANFAPAFTRSLETSDLTAEYPLRSDRLL